MISAKECWSEVRACYSGPLWHVAYTEPRAEKDVCADIASGLGFGIFMPMERLKTGSRPLFARYLFVEVNPYRQDWQAVCEVDGVCDVLMASDDVPGYVPTAKIVALMKAEAYGMFDRTTALPNHFEINERVRVSDGPYAGIEAIILEFLHKMRSATASKRAKLLTEGMGRMMTLELPITSIEKLLQI